MRTTHDIAEAQKAIQDTKGKIASVTFIKRSTKEKVTRRVRTGVKRDVKGVGQSYDPASKGLFTIFDMEHDNGPGKPKGRHKNIPLDAIEKVICGDLQYTPERSK